MGRGRGGPGLLGTMARTAVVAGTAQAVAGKVGQAQQAAAHREQQSAAAQEQLRQVQMQAQVDAQVADALRDDTLVVSIMHANNETGVLQPIAALARRHGVLLHTDAAQSVGKVPVSVDALGVDLLAVAGELDDDGSMAEAPAHGANKSPPRQQPPPPEVSPQYKEFVKWAHNVVNTSDVLNSLQDDVWPVVKPIAQARGMSGDQLKAHNANDDFFAKCREAVQAEVKQRTEAMPEHDANAAYAAAKGRESAEEQPQPQTETI